jgi:hypothetical protein
MCEPWPPNTACPTENGTVTTQAMRRLAAIVVLAVHCGILGGCGSAMKNLRSRAAFDLGCPEGELQTQELGGGAWGVTGCGKKATYVKAGPHGKSSWVLNSKQ